MVGKKPEFKEYATFSSGQGRLEIRIKEFHLGTRMTGMFKC